MLEPELDDKGPIPWDYHPVHFKVRVLVEKEATSVLNWGMLLPGLPRALPGHCDLIFRQRRFAEIWVHVAVFELCEV
jgi:hypothetical protein